MIKALINGQIVFHNRIEQNKIILFDENIIDIVDSVNEKEYEIIDLKGNYVSAGFIDIHIHGSNGSDAMHGTEEALQNISESVAKNGVTSFLATTMTQSDEAITKAFEAVKACVDKDEFTGAKVAGIHVEGPFISTSHKGAQAEEYIKLPNMELIRNFLDYIKIITVAPEVDGMMDFIEKLKDESDSVKFSIGHSGASFEQAVKGFESGIDSTTHTFNGMTGLHHRNPGVIGAVFKKSPYFEVIADNIHVHPGLYDVLGNSIGKDKMILITDAMCACNMEPGCYELGGQKVTVDATSARLEGGVLAGSILKFNDAIKNVLHATDYELFEVIKMATETPAKMLGIDNIGRMQKGCKADLTVFDKQLNIYNTIVNGEIVYRKDL